MNYQEEVQKVYPYAYGQRMMGIYLIVDGEDENYEGAKELGKISYSEGDSWKSAYKKLVKKNKIAK